MSGAHFAPGDATGPYPGALAGVPEVLRRLADEGVLPPDVRRRILRDLERPERYGRGEHPDPEPTP